MSALTFTLKQRTDQRVDMSPLVCQKLSGMEPADIAEIELQNGKRKVRVDELFKISGSDTRQIKIKNSFGKLDFIGKELKEGKISVEGNVGAYLGMGMSSGSIEIYGNTDIYAACEMKGGQLLIEGNAGDYLGGAMIGNKQGMKGGVVIVRGNAGDRAGDHMRRGVMLIEGDAGDYCGSRMAAGTIAVLGKTGRFPGHMMVRGTLLFWSQPQLSASFNDCGAHTLAFLPILLNSFKKFNTKFAEVEIFNRVQRFGGDMAEKGLGEILVKI